MLDLRSNNELGLDKQCDKIMVFEAIHKNIALYLQQNKGQREVNIL